MEYGCSFGRRLSLTSVVPDGVRLAVGYSSPSQNGNVLPILRFHVPQRCGRPMSKPKPTFYSLATKTQLNPNCTSCISPTTPPWGITRNLLDSLSEHTPHLRVSTPSLSYIYTNPHDISSLRPFSLSLSLSNSIIPLVKHTHTVPQMHMYILPPPSQRQNGFFGLAGEISSICRKRLVWNKNSWSKIQRASG